MSTSPIFVATFADKVCTRMSIYCTPDDLDLERGKRLARYAYESRTSKPAPAFTKAHFEDTNSQVLMSYSAIDSTTMPTSRHSNRTSRRRHHLARSAGAKARTAESADAKTNARSSSLPRGAVR